MIKRKKVLHLLNSKSVFGAERVAIEIINRLPEIEYDVHVGLINGSLEMVTEVQGKIDSARVKTLSFKNEKGTIFTLHHLYKYCKQHKIDIIHSHGYKSNILSYIVNIIQKNIVLVCTNHSHIISSTREIIYNYIDLRVLSQFDHVVAVTKDVQKKMVNSGFKKKSITVIENCISTEVDYDNEYAKKWRHEICRDDNCILVGVVASLTVEKAHEDVFKAIHECRKKYKSIYLAVIGDGPLYDDLKAKASELYLNKIIHFTGYRNDVRAILPALDLLVLFSKTEGLPMAILEAMSAKVPIIATRVGAIPKLLQNGKSGLLVDVGDIEGMVKGILNMAKNEDMRNHFAEKAFKRVQDRYSINRMANRYKEIYGGYC